MKLLFRILLSGFLSITLIKASATTIDIPHTDTQVSPINWQRFDKPVRESKDMMQSRRILANAARYNLGWIGNTFRIDSLHDLYIIDRYNENGIRPAASVCYGLAVALKCAGLSDKELGTSRATAFRHVIMLVKGVAAAYKANRTDGKGWGNDWQTAFWATLSGQGAWMIWDSLDAETQHMVQIMVTNEADRFIAPDYKVPYWTSPNGHVNTPGDTKAEENAWNADVLQLAVAMMPQHPHAGKWKRVCSELMVSAFSLKKDLQNSSIVDGKPVKEWLHGFNVRDDGAVINHHLIHPDYTVTVTLNARAFLTQPLAGEPVSQAAEWNASFIYRSLAEHVWPSPPYKAPGGAMYIPRKATVYYPQGTDWSKYRFDIYYLTDVNAHILGWDKGLKHEAKEWMRIRASRILAMQARHSDGHMFTHEEYPTYPGCEQMVAWQAADAYLLFWLHAHHAVPSTSKAEHTWLSS